MRAVDAVDVVDAAPLLTVGSLLRSLRSLRDHATQAARWQEILIQTPTEGLLSLLEALIVLNLAAHPDAREVWLSLIAAVVALKQSQGGLDRLCALREHLHGSPSPTRLALYRCLLLTRPPHRRLERPPHTLCPAWDRDMTLGEKLALASKPSRVWLERLLLEPEPSIILRLTRHPRLTLQDLLRVASRRPTLPSVQWAIAQSPQWFAQLPVRLALTANPYTETTLSLLVLPTLPHETLLDLAHAGHLHPDLHATAQHLIESPK